MWDKEENRDWKQKEWRKVAHQLMYGKLPRDHVAENGQKEGLKVNRIDI